MAEAQIGFLYNIASALCKSGNNVHNFLRSYYLMRCKTITHGHGLPQKQFSFTARCPRCCLERSKEDNIKVRPIKLSKRQRKRIKSANFKSAKKKRIEKKRALLSSNELEQICSFCKNKTTTPILKPLKESFNKKKELTESSQPLAKKPKIMPANALDEISKQKQNTKSNPKVNLYTSAFDIFSLNNKNNSIQNTIKEAPKVIKNNKKKKDKFAGLCQQAVLASAKIKREKQSNGQNKLDLFLKPSA